MSTTCLTSASQQNLNVPVISSASQKGIQQKQQGKAFLTPTLRTSHSPSYVLPHSSRKIQSASVDRNKLQLPSFVFAQQHNRNTSPSSPRNIQDRLIPCRSQTDMQLAQHLLSPMSHRPGGVGENDTEQQDSCRQVTRILNFGNKTTKAKPLSLVTASLAYGTNVHAKSKFKIPTKPDRVMAAPGTFLECGFQSAHWAPSANLVVALETGVYVCKINEDCNVSEIRNNTHDPENPFCHVIWDNSGDAVICGKMSGEIQIYDVRSLFCRNKWYLTAKQTLRSIALEQEHLLTCGTVGHGVRIYDLRQTGGESPEPILSLKSRSSVNCLSWSTNGHLFAGGCESGFTCLWDVRRPSKEMMIFKTQDKNPVQVVNWCSWKPSILFCGSSFPRPSICIQNTATGMLVGDFECASEISGIHFNAQLKQVASSHHSSLQDATESHAMHGKESSVQLWKFNSDKLNPILELGQHEEGIVSMAASVNSSQLVTMGVDELLCLWHWNETAHHSNSHKAGFQTARSQLDSANLIR
ncbi:uncharacterized protein LOC130693517 [Daphnia carinata]|uniref:uncharacterized protein LOC130693517 n=1 Tax=Daphnia carinata TaxID=120202 RepID=UPI00257D9632|nr:uncharacterized protein LOC130693517 [Daphnia carinata]